MFVINLTLIMEYYQDSERFEMNDKANDGQDIVVSHSRGDTPSNVAGVSLTGKLDVGLTVSSSFAH